MNGQESTSRAVECYFYHETQIKRELNGIHICGCRFNERLKAKTDGSTRLGYTGLHGELEHIAEDVPHFGPDL